MKPRVLVVEDESIVAMDLSRRLRKHGLDVVSVASSGEEAIRIARDAGPDVILMDIALDGHMDGIEAALTIRSEADVPIVFLSAYSDTPNRTRAMEAHPAAYLVKPFEDDELLDAIRAAVSRERTE